VHKFLGLCWLSYRRATGRVPFLTRLDFNSCSGYKGRELVAIATHSAAKDRRNGRRVETPRVCPRRTPWVLSATAPTVRGRLGASARPDLGEETGILLRRKLYAIV
jgi:hypothetical protein